MNLSLRRYICRGKPAPAAAGAFLYQAYNLSGFPDRNRTTL